MNYVISTEIDGILYCVKTNKEKNCFDLQPVKGVADFRKVFMPCNNSQAAFILNWINKHDEFLASKQLEIHPAAKYQ